ncbi:MAG TPA: cytochrome c biogenesis protein CcdA, partial [Chitinophagaceae bacterium]|nr:cytochrome c biogenesis protein CcdA [Chitinophagaceae bacterium]
MYKRILFFFLYSFLFIAAYAQDSTAFSWSVKSERLAAGEYRLSFTTPVNNNWQLYAPGQDISGIPSAALIFKDSSIAIITPLTGSEGSKTIKSAIFDNQPFRIYEGNATWTATIKIPGEVPSSLLGAIQYTYGKGDEFYPSESKDFEVSLEGGIVVNNRIRLESIDLANPVQQCGIEKEEKKGSLWKIFLLGFLGGLVALLTPCVFPMIPLTVSFFTKKSGDQKGTSNAVIYGFFIFLIYVSFSIPFHLIGTVSPTIYNDISTNIWLNLAFFIVFIVFAISFFGYFEITLPSGLANKANARQSGNLLGIFFMALTLAI